MAKSEQSHSLECQPVEEFDWNTCTLVLWLKLLQCLLNAFSVWTAIAHDLFCDPYFFWQMLQEPHVFCAETPQLQRELTHELLLQDQGGILTEPISSFYYPGDHLVRAEVVPVMMFSKFPYLSKKYINSYLMELV